MKHNFGAGPCILPQEVFKQASEAILNFNDTGLSILEISHRSKEFEAVVAEAESLIRDLLSVPHDYSVLFLQGGARQQFAMVPMNLVTEGGKMAYLDTGSWASQAIKEARNFGEVGVVASGKDSNYTIIPKEYHIPSDAAYFHYTSNNTIFGTELFDVPESRVPIVCDMSSDILSRKIDVSKFGLIFAGAQKNVGPAGVTIVIIREDLITEEVYPGTPTMLRYKIHADNESLYNTPPTYGIYICGKVFKWIKKMGGLQAMKEYNEKKAKILYDFLDESKLFKGTVRKEDRSLMNVPFVTGNDELDAKFVKEAKAEGLESLKGHRSVGGMRASIYNAMPIEGVEKLVAFMKKFEEENL